MRKNKVTYKTIVAKPTLQPTFWDEAYPLEVSRSDDRFWPILNIARKLNTSTGRNLTLVLVGNSWFGPVFRTVPLVGINASEEYSIF